MSDESDVEFVKEETKTSKKGSDSPIELSSGSSQASFEEERTMVKDVEKSNSSKAPEKPKTVDKPFASPFVMGGFMTPEAVLVPIGNVPTSTFHPGSSSASGGFHAILTSISFERMRLQAPARWDGVPWMLQKPGMGGVSPSQELSSDLWRRWTAYRTWCIQVLVTETLSGAAAELKQNLKVSSLVNSGELSNALRSRERCRIVRTMPIHIATGAPTDTGPEMLPAVRAHVRVRGWPGDAGTSLAMMTWTVRGESRLRGGLCIASKPSRDVDDPDLVYCDAVTRLNGVPDAWGQSLYPSEAVFSTVPTVVVLIRLGSVGPQTREWCALHALPHTPFAKTILSLPAPWEPTSKYTPSPPNPHPTPTSLSLSYDVDQRIRNALNTEQLEAVRAAAFKRSTVDRPRIVAVHGPPGTGKTSTLSYTVLGMLNWEYHEEAVPKEDAAVVAGASLPKQHPPKRIPAPKAGTKRDLGSAANVFFMPNTKRKRPLALKESVSSKVVGSSSSSSSAVASATRPSKWSTSRVLVAATSNAAVDGALVRLNGVGRGIETLRLGVGAVHAAARRRTISQIATKEQRRRSDVARDGNVFASTLGAVAAGSWASGLAQSVTRNDREMLWKACVHAVVIDEAGQATDSSVLCAIAAASPRISLARARSAGVPLYQPEDPFLVYATTLAKLSDSLTPAWNPPTVVLFGDPMQLPATILSRHVSAAGASNTLLERCLTNLDPSDCVMLREQYRMREQISAFPNAHFYGGALRNSRSILSLPKPRHPPFQFVNVVPNTAQRHRTSYSNESEAQLAIDIAKEALRRLPPPTTIGIIAPYARQVDLIRRAAQRAGGIVRSSDIATVDGFQGAERDVIILSAVRSKAHGDGGIGFVRAPRRLNVAITRARHALFVLGDSEWLARHCPHWAALIQHAKSTGTFH